MNGELRWYVSDEKGEDREVPNGDPVMVGADMVKPKSRTFIPSSVDDNLFLLSTGYKETLRALPEPLRSQMLRGDFQAGAADPAWQTIPTEWVKAAQARWAEKQAKGTMTAIGFDPARGGIDKSTLARRHGQWFDKLITAPGIVTKDGPTAAAGLSPLARGNHVLAGLVRGVLVDCPGGGLDARKLLHHFARDPAQLGLRECPVTGLFHRRAGGLVAWAHAPEVQAQLANRVQLQEAAPHARPR